MNQAKFMDNDKCGYLLRPEFMFKDGYKPGDRSGPSGVTSLELTIRIVAARHLYRSGKERGLSPLVEVEVMGAEYDSVKYRTKRVDDNGLNPVWDETFKLKILNPDIALVRFYIYDEDMFENPHMVGQVTLPVRLVQAGYRSVQLRNGHSEELELSSLLLHVTKSQVISLESQDYTYYISK